MDKVVFQVLTNNKVFFCKNRNDITTTSIEVMKDCFDVFVVEEGWLFYRLTEDCVERGFVDRGECMIGPCDEYDQMICMGKVLDSNGEPIDIFESSIWIEEDEFNINRRNNTIKSLITELTKIKEMEDSDNIPSDHENIPEVNSEEDEMVNELIKDNFKHGYSSGDISEESYSSTNQESNNQESNHEGDGPTEDSS